MKVGSMLMTFLLVGIFATSTAEARKHEGKGKKFDKIAKELNLTAEQKTKLAEIKKAKWAGNKELKQKMKALMANLEEKVKSNAGDDELRKIHSECQALRMQMADARFEGILAIRSILTPEQRARFGEFHKMGRGHNGRHGDSDDDDGDED